MKLQIIISVLYGLVLCDKGLEVYDGKTVANFVAILPDFYQPTGKGPILDWVTGTIGTPVYNIFGSKAKPTNCTSCACGQSETGSRIIGGQETKVNDYPWMVALYFSNRFTCGGTLINDRYVLTAAHCVIRANRSKFLVRLLVHNRKTDKNVMERGVNRVLMSGYNFFTNNNDVALLQLDSPVEFSPELYPACLPPNRNDFAGYDAIVTGWGKTESGEISDTLKELHVPILTNEMCKRAGYFRFQITSNMLCAGYLEGGKDSCQGDSGGPLHIKDPKTERLHIAGVVSWGNNCAMKNYPGVYARVNRFLTWLNFNTRDACTCA